MSRASKAWGALLADILARGEPFRRGSNPHSVRVRFPGKKPVIIKDSCGEGYDHEAGQQLTGRGESWLTGQYTSGSTLGSSPAEYRRKFF